MQITPRFGPVGETFAKIVKCTGSIPLSGQQISTPQLLHPIPFFRSLLTKNWFLKSDHALPRIKQQAAWKELQAVIFKGRWIPRTHRHTVEWTSKIMRDVRAFWGIEFGFKKGPWFDAGLGKRIFGNDSLLPKVLPTEPKRQQRESTGAPLNLIFIVTSYLKARMLTTRSRFNKR